MGEEKSIDEVFPTTGEEEPDGLKPEISGSEMLKKRFRKINTLNDNNEEAWMPEEVGEKITCQLLEVRPDAGKYGQTIYLVKDSNDKKRTILGCKVLDQCMEQVDIHDTIVVIYNGTQTGGNGNTYKLFEVLVEI